MRISKLIAKLSFSGALILGLAACEMPKPTERKNSMDSSATFVTEAVNGKEVLQKVNGAYSIPSAKVYQFSTCIRDLKGNKIIGHEFQIVEVEINSRTDANGCVHWQEEVQFNYQQSAKYIELERTVRALNFHKGQRQLKIGVNPWADKDSVADLKQEARPNVISEKDHMTVQGKSSGEDGSTMMVKSITYKVRETIRTKEKVQLVYDLDFNPLMLTTDINGQMVVRDINVGDFEITAYLLNTNLSNGRYPIISSSTVTQSVTAKVGLSAAMTFDISCIPTTKDLLIGLKVRPKTEGQLASFEGLFTTGANDDIKKGGRSDLNPLAAVKGFKLESVLGKQLDKRDCQKEGFQKPKIEIRKLDFTILNVDKELTSSREFHYTVRACLVDGIDQKPIRSSNITIFKFRKSTSDREDSITVTTDNSSCVSWNEVLEHKFYECQHFFPGFVRLKNDTLGLDETINVAINPWEHWFTGRDLRYSNASETLRFSCDSNQLQSTVTMKMFYMNPYVYPDTQTSVRYEIDKFLKLKQFRHYLIRTEPRVLVYSSLGKGREENERLRDGVYLLRVAVGSQQPQNKIKLIDGVEKFIHVKDGTVKEYIEFGTYELKEFGNRNKIFFELLPVKESAINVSGANGEISLKSPLKDISAAIDRESGLMSATHVGDLILSEANNTAGLEELDRTPMANYFINKQGIAKNHEVIPELLKQKQDIEKAHVEVSKKAADINLFAKANNLVQLNPYDTVKNANLYKALGVKIDTGFLGNVGRVSDPRHYQKIFSAATPATPAAIEPLLNTGKMTPELAQKMCLFWFHTVLPSLYANKGGAINQYISDVLIMKCITESAKDPNALFWTDRRLIVENIGKYEYVKGFNRGHSVSSGFSLSNSHAETFGTSKTLGFTAGATWRFFDVLSAGGSAGYSMAWGKNDSESQANSVSVNSMTSLTEYENVFRILLTEYRECATIRLNLKFFYPEKKAEMFDLFGQRNWRFSLNRELNERELTDALTKGFLLCKPTITKKPVVKTETFYLINQEGGNLTAAQDPTDPRNRNFFMALRGHTDHDKFMSLIKGEMLMPLDSGTTGVEHSDTQSRIEAAFKNFEGSKAEANVIKNLFKNLNSFPGNYLDSSH